MVERLKEWSTVTTTNMTTVEPSALISTTATCELVDQGTRQVIKGIEA
ncbi:hypothetical protein LJE72_22620 [Desulfosporosinus sp. SRJS8]|nr:hypothetical protein [Desulfosporosinus sp. SRJS8]